MTKKFGFTLAEVLITLGIIGVVAAMTMPTLMNATNGAQYKAAYKKALSAIAQGITLNMALDDVDFSATTESGFADGSIAKVLQTRMNVVKTSNAGLGYDIDKGANSGVDANISGSATNTTLFFNDGSAFSFPSTVTACTLGGGATAESKCYGIVDVNGQKKPNKVVGCDATADENCKVSKPTDVYPVQFYDAQILPNSHAARAVLYGE